MATRAIDGYRVLVERLSRTRRRLRTTQLLAGLAYWMAGSLAVLVLACAVDNLFHLSAAGRWVALAAVTGSIAAGFGRLVARPALRRYSEDAMALFVQDRFPDRLGNCVINAVQIARENNGRSSPFVDALVEESVERSAGCDFAQAVEARPVRRALILAAVCALAAAGYAVAFPSHLANAATRLVSPEADLPPLGVPRLVVTPGDCRVVAGDDLTVSVRVEASALPEAVELRFAAGRSSWHIQSLGLGSGGIADHTFRQVIEPFQYQVALADTETRRYQVQVVARPAVVELGMEYHYPAYTRLAVRRVDNADGEIKAPVGTRVRLRIGANKPLAECTLKLDPERSVAAAVAPQAPRTALADLDVASSGSYAIHFVDSDGIVGTTGPKPIVAVPDANPVVRIIHPAGDVTLTPEDELKVALEASDDFGLGGVELRTAGQSRGEQVAQQWTLKTPSETFAAEGVLNLARLGLKPGDVLTYFGQAVDVRGSAEPGVGRSATYRITVVDKQTRQAQALERRRAAARDLRALLADQQLARADVDRLRQDLAEGRLDLQQAQTRLAGPVQWQTGIRTDAMAIASGLKSEGSALGTALEELAAGLMVQAVARLEQARAQKALADVAQPLLEARQTQTAIIDELQRLIGRETREQTAAGVHHILKVFSELLQRQEQLQADTAGRKAPAAALADRQSRLAEDTAAARRTLGQTAEALKAATPELGKAFEEAAGLMDGRTIPEKMRRAAETIRADNLAGAGQTQAVVVADLEAVIRALLQALADNARRAQKQMEEAARQMARKARDMMELEKKIDAKTRDLDKQPQDRLSDEDKKALDKLAEMQSRLADAAEKSSQDAKLLPKHEWSDEMAKSWEEVRKYCEASAEALKKEPTTTVIPRNEKILEELKKTEEKARSNQPDPEGVLSSQPDRTKIKMENFKPEELPLIKPDQVPEKIRDLVGNLVDKLEDQTEDVEDETSNWARKNSTSGLSVDGPMSTFGGKGQTGNRIPDPAEMTGRSGAGRAGKASGELIEGETKNIPGGKNPPPRRTDDPFQKGEVKDNNPDQPSGATGGGKKGGLGAEGLEGKRRPDPDEEDLKDLARRQMQLRQSAQKLVDTFALLNLPLGRLPEAVRLLKEVEDDLVAQRVEGVMPRQRAALVALRETYRGLAGSGHVEVTAPALAEPYQKEIQDAIERGFPPQYRALLEAYYKSLSTAGR